MKSIRQELLEAREATAVVFPSPRSVDADLVARHALDGKVLFSFHGLEPIQVGRRGIDWSGSHHKHQEWPAQLNRFFQLDGLRCKYLQTRDDRYAQCARDYIEDWIAFHPRLHAATPGLTPGDSTLNMSIRLGGVQFSGWLGTAVDFLPSPAFDDEFLDRIVDSVAGQMEWLSVNLHARGNWRISELDSLFSNSLRVPSRLGRFRPAAAEGLNTEFAWQILPDGVHEERCAGYHSWMCNVYLKLWELGRSRGELGLKLDDRRVARMQSYILHHTKPNGHSCGFNDASSEFRTTPQSASTLRDLLRTQEALNRQVGIDGPVPRLGVFESAGQVFYRTGWGSDDLWWAFDGGAWGSGHTHLSQLSIELHNGQRTTLPDGGIFDYEMSNPMGPAGKSTPAHSTMNVNLGNQANMTDISLRMVKDTPAAVIVHGRYEGGYWTAPLLWWFSRGHGSGVYGSHDRILVWLKDRAMVVLDSMDHDSDQSVYLHWVGDDVPYEMDAQALRIRTGDREGNVLIQVCPMAPAAAQLTVHKGEENPPLGFVAENHIVRPAPLFQFMFRHDTPAGPQQVSSDCATVIVPFCGDDAPKVSITGRPLGDAAREVLLNWADGRMDRIVYTPRMAKPLRTAGDVQSDAAMVIFCAKSGEKEPHATVIGGTYVERTSRP